MGASGAGNPNTILRSVAASRLAPPALPKKFVSRQALAERLEASPLALVIAPGGYGKTSLLTEFVQVSKGGYWYTVRQDDADTAHFAYGLGLAISKGLPKDVWEEVKDVLPATSGTAAASMLAGLLEQLKPGWRLVIDDVHLITGDPAPIGLLDSLLQDAPVDTGHIVLGGRAVPELGSLSRARAAGRLAEVEAADLRFDAELAAAALDSEGLTQEEIEQLVQVCGGWPALMRLAGSYLSALAPAERTTALAALGGSHGALYDYIATQLFEDVSSELRALFLRTSFCESFSPELAEALVGAPVTKPIRTAEAQRWLLRTDTADGPEYSYHPLIADFLQARARSEFASAELGEIMNKAGEFLAAKQQWDGAFALWQRAGLHQKIIAQLTMWEDSNVDYWSVHGRWLNSLSETDLKATPRLIIRRSFGHIFAANVNEAFRWLEIAERFAAESGCKEAIDDARIHRATLYYFAQELDRGEALLLELESEKEQLTDAQLLSVYGGLVLVEIDRCENLDRAVELLDLIEGIARKIQHWRALGICLANRVLVERLRGNLGEVSMNNAAARRSHPSAIQNVPRFYLVMGEGVRLADLGLEKCVVHMRECIRLAELSNYNWLGASIRMALAVFYSEKGSVEDAQAEIDACAATPTTHLGVAYGLKAARAVVAARRGDGDSVRRILDSMPSVAFAATGSYDATAAHALLLVGDKKGAAVWAARCATEAKRRKMKYVEANCLYMLAAAEAATPDDLERLIDLVRTNGYEPMFLNRWPAHAAKVLTQALAVNADPPFVLDLLRQIGTQTLRIRTASGLRVWVDDKEITDQDWERPRSKAVFVYLLLNDERPVHAEEISEIFWPDQDPSAAKNSLRVAATRIRKAIERDEKRLIFEGDHYRLELGSSTWQDRRAFEQLVETGLTKKDPGEAVRVLGRALALYPGEFLPEYRYEEWAAEERERLEAIRRRARIRLSKSLIALERPEEAIPICEEASASDPFDETAVRLHIRALAALERQDEARKVFLRLRNDLAEQLHAEPTKATRELARELQLTTR